MRNSSFPITQPPIPGLFPGPSPRNKLRSPRSVSSLTDGRHVDNRSTSVLATPQSSLALNKRNREPSQPGLGLQSIASTSTSSISALPSGRTRPPSSLLSATPIQSPYQKVQKSGFFSRLFIFGKSKHKEPVAQRSTNRLRKPMSKTLTPTSSRPMSTISVDSITSSTRQRAVLVKKSPVTPPTKRDRHSPVQTRASPYQHTRSHSSPQPTYPQVGASLLSFIPEEATTVPPLNYATSSSNLNYTEFNPAASTTSLVHTPGPIPSDVSRPFRPQHVQGPATASSTLTQNPGVSNYYGQYPSYTNGGYFGAQDSGYQSLATTPSPILCTVCNINPRYTEPSTGETLPHCSDTCRRAGTAATSQIQAVCSYPGCTQPAVMYPANHYWNYCSESHERYARKGCISCRDADDSGTQLCKKCKETFKQRAPTIIPVPMDHDAFWNVVDKFSESWANPTQSPIFQAARVFKIVLTQDRRDTYLGYRDTLEYYGRFTMKGKSNGNERILWHGTRRSCYLGEGGQFVPCMIPRCSLCTVIRGPPYESKLATDTPAGRFGTGIYTFTRASKADGHSSNEKNIETPWVALLLGKVAAGHECVMRHDNTTLTAPPQGYDSVIGEVRGRLNYDELVVYTSDAIRPTWLVLYQRT